eukprot:9012548-Alexandrium_andersonii.AAC.1
MHELQPGLHLSFANTWLQPRAHVHVNIGTALHDTPNCLDKFKTKTCEFVSTKSRGQPGKSRGKRRKPWTVYTAQLCNSRTLFIT